MDKQKNTLKPYSIFSPPFDVTSGGIRVMYGLYGWLLAKGQIAFMNAVYENLDFIAVYPEIMNGNPANAKTVVRYILNKPGFMSDGQSNSPTEFPQTDIKYYFSRVFGETDNDHYLFLPIINLHLFRDYGNKRTKKGVFFGKGLVTNQHPKDCVPITRELAQDQQALADLLNECEVIYCYDQVSAMYDIARLCGARVVVFPTAMDFETFSKYETGLNGLSWGEDTNEQLDAKAFRVQYEQMRQTFEKKLDKFIQETQDA